MAIIRAAFPFYNRLHFRIYYVNPPVTSASARNFYSASLLLLISSNLAAALNYGFQGMMRRNLSVADFGLMNALFYFSGFLSLPVGIYTNTLARRWAELGNVARHEEADHLWCALMVAATAICVVSTLVMLAFLPVCAWWLQTSNLKAVAVMVLGTAFGILFGLAALLATARQWFGLLAVGGLLGGLFRIVLGWAGAHFQTPLSGAVAATSLSGGILAILVFRRVRWPGWASLPFRQLLPAAGEWAAPALVAFSLLCIMGSDMLVVRRFHAPREAGVFVEVMILGRIIFFLIGPISTVVFPKTATSLQTDESIREKKVVRRALVLGAGLLLLGAAAICLFAPIGFTLLGSAADPEKIRYLRIAVWCLIPLSLCQLVIPSLFARRQERYLLEFALLSLLLPVGLAVFRQNLIQAFLVEGVVGAILLGFISLRLKASLDAGAVPHPTTNRT